MPPQNENFQERQVFLNQENDKLRCKLRGIDAEQQVTKRKSGNSEVHDTAENDAKKIEAITKSNAGGYHPDIIKLNQAVLRQTIRAVDDAVKDGKYEKLDDTYKLVLEGATVYEDRYLFIVYFLYAATVFMVIQETNIKSNLLVMVLSYLYYDFFSGVLHVVLDEPENLRGWRALLMQKPCLEFQWHHAIPRDIADKPYVYACGDLAGLAAAVFVYHIVVNSAHTNSLAICALGWKLAFAFFGQFSHRSSHQNPSKVSPIAKKMQQWGLMMSPDMHRQHHRTHDQAFCIGSGIFNPVIDGMRQVTTNPNAWMILLGFLLLADLQLFVGLTERAVATFGW